MGRLLTVGRAMVVIGLAGVLTAAAACSSDSKDSSDKGATPAGSPSAVEASGAVDASGNIAIVAKDNSYTVGKVTAKAGQKVTVSLDNQGAAIHNFAVQGQKGPDGQDIQSPLLNAKQKGTVEFTLPAGTYDFYCSVHPVEMRGKLVVE